MIIVKRIKDLLEEILKRCFGKRHRDIQTSMTKCSMKPMRSKVKGKIRYTGKLFQDSGYDDGCSGDVRTGYHTLKHGECDAREGLRRELTEPHTDRH